TMEYRMQRRAPVPGAGTRPTAMINLPCVLYLIRDLDDSRLLCARKAPRDLRAPDERDHVAPCRLIDLHPLPQPRFPWQHSGLRGSSQCLAAVRDFGLVR